MLTESLMDRYNNNIVDVEEIVMSTQEAAASAGQVFDMNSAARPIFGSEFETQKLTNEFGPMLSTLQTEAFTCRRSNSPQTPLRLRNRYDLKLVTTPDMMASCPSSSHLSVEKLSLAMAALQDDCSPTTETPPTSSSASSSQEKKVDNDSGFSSDECSPDVTPIAKNKIERTKTLPSALRRTSEAHKVSPSKSVRFADSLGLDLEHKFHFFNDDDEDDTWTPSACVSSFRRKPPTSPSTAAVVPPAPKYRLFCRNFSYRTEMETRRLTTARNVCLSAINVIDMNVTGVVSVANLAFAKSVIIRYTTDNWQTSADSKAVFMHNNGLDMDAFSFFISLPNTMTPGSNCQLCIRYDVNGCSYWDSNNGSNYYLECVENTDSSSHREPQWKRKLNASLHRSTVEIDDGEMSDHEHNFVSFRPDSGSSSQQQRQCYSYDVDSMRFY